MNNQLHKEYIQDLQKYIRKESSDLKYFLARYRENIFNQKRATYSNAVARIKQSIRNNTNLTKELNANL